MGKISDSLIISGGTNKCWTGGGSQHVVVTPNGVIYIFFLNGSSVIVYTKSTDGGLTFNSLVTFDATAGFSGTALSVCYDRWSGINADLIHVAYTDANTDDVFYRNLDAANSDTLSSIYRIFDGSTTAAGGTLSIARMRGGNLICGGCIDGGTELFCYKSTDVGANWSSIAAVSEANQDQLILLPGWAADNQDAMAFFWDASADEISRKLYDDSANSWAEASIATSMVDQAAATAYPHFAAAVDITNSRNLLVAWSAVDSANADLRCWYITESAIIEVTNVVLNSGDDQGLCAIGIDINTQYWYVYYSGKSDGSETIGTAVNIYYKVSQDSGTTWGAETKISNKAYIVNFLINAPRFSLNNFILTGITDVSYNLRILIPINFPRSNYQLGL